MRQATAVGGKRGITPGNGAFPLAGAVLLQLQAHTLAWHVRADHSVALLLQPDQGRDIRPANVAAPLVQDSNSFGFNLAKVRLHTSHAKGPRAGITADEFTAQVTPGARFVPAISVSLECNGGNPVKAPLAQQDPEFNVACRRAMV